MQLFPEANSRDAAEYEVQVFTADIRGAGTDGKVSIRLVGDKGASRWVDLDKPVEAADGNGAALFSRGAIDTFAVTAADVGDLSHVVVRLGSVQHSDWNLTKIEALHQVRVWEGVADVCRNKGKRKRREGCAGGQAGGVRGLCSTVTGALKRSRRCTR